MTAARATLVAALALVLLVGLPARPAAAKETPCWNRLLVDWYDGRIDKTYPIPCYEAALAHLPDDLKFYSSAHDDLQRELQSALARKQAKTTTTTAAPTETKTTEATPTPTSARPPTPPPTQQRTTVQPPPSPAPSGGPRPRGGVSKVANAFDPGSPDSLPLPLLVLAGLSLLLVAAGAAGAAVRYRQNRRPSH